MCNQVQSNSGVAYKQKRALIMLAICVAVILIATIFSSMIQTAGWRYTVEDLRSASNKGTISLVATDDGETEAKDYTVTGKVVSGTLFRPKNAAEGSRPAIVYSHGLYNNREMQLQNAIEMVRRGYVVMVIDQANHGHSLSSNGQFNGTDHLDACKYLWNLPEVDKTKIAASGHSMGGSSTNNVLKNDSVTADSQTAENFKNGLHMGIVSAYLVQANNAPSQDNIGSNVIAVGIFKGNADEFFFNSTLREPDYVAKNRGSVTADNYDNGTFYLKKGGEYVLQTSEDRFKPKAQYYQLTTSANTAWYLQSKQAFTFTRSADPTKDDTDWTTVNGGIYAGGSLIAEPNGRKLVSVARKGEALASATQSLRAVYEAAETHPMNHFSTATAANLIDFCYNAFGVVDGYRYKAPTNQTWWMKEGFSGLGLIALFAMLIPIIDLLLQTKLFASLKGEPSEAPILLTRPRKHVSYWLGGILTTIFGAVSFHNLVDYGKWYSKLGLNALLDNKAEGFIYANVGKIAAWGMMCAVFALLVTGIIWAVNHFINVWKYGDDFGAHDESPFDGFKIRSISNIWKTLLLAALLVAIFYGVVTLIWNLTCVEFQVWVFGTRTFTLTRIASMLKYVPFFLVYYLVSAALAQGYRVKDLPEWATIAINVFFNVAGFTILVWYANSYFINNGAMMHTGASGSMGNPMHYIHAFPMVPSIAIATVLARRIYVRTGNAWLAGLVNATIMTFIACANTSISGSVAWVYGA